MFPQLRIEIASDLRANGFHQSGASAFLRAYFLHPGFHVLLTYRLRRRLVGSNPLFRLLACLIEARSIARTGCFISAKAVIEGGINLPHATGIVIGIGVKIEKNVMIYQQVTLGESKIGSLRYPEVCEGATLYAGAKVIGPIRIGRNAIVGANAVVVSAVPDGAVAVGVPARILPSILVDDSRPD